MSSTTDGERVARFFTSARNVSIRLGKWPGGGRIPGGPYTITQILIGSATLVVGWWSRPFWGPSVGSFIVQLATLAIAAVGATWLSGRIPSTRRKIPSLTLDAFSAVTASSYGTYKGKTITARPPRAFTGSVLMQFDEDILDSIPAMPTPAAASAESPGSMGTDPVPAESAKVPPASAPAAPDNVSPFKPREGYQTGLDRLLDQARRKEN